MHFKHISAKIQPKNLKQHFDWGGGPPSGYALGISVQGNCVFLLFSLIGAFSNRNSLCEERQCHDDAFG